MDKGKSMDANECMGISISRVAINCKDAMATAGRPTIEMFKIYGIFKDIRSGKSGSMIQYPAGHLKVVGSSPTCVQFFSR
jgi:hypothetical protein